MSTVKLSLASMSVPDKIQFARQVATGFTNQSGTFPAPPYVPHALLVKAGALESAYNAAQTARQLSVQKTTDQANAEAALDSYLTADAGYVQSTSAGDAALIESVGMSVRSSSAPVGALPAPQQLIATTTTALAQVTLRWKSVKGAKSYQIQTATDITGAGNWQSAASSTKSRCVVTGLASGTKYWFRVAAIGAAGQGPWSDAAIKIAP